MKRKFGGLRCISFFFSVLSAQACAMDWLDGKLQLHGYLSQGLVYTDHNHFYGASQGSISPDFREMGLNFSARPLAQLRLAVQGMSRWAGRMDEGDPWLDFALADLSLINRESMRIGMRAGRIKNPFGLYTETRDVAFTRPGIILPQAIYFDRTRRFALSGDGVHLYGEFQLPGGRLDARLVWVDLPINDKSTIAALFNDANASGTLNQDRFTPGMRLLYETDDSRWRAAFTFFSLSQKYQPAAGEAIRPTHLTLNPWIVSLQYDHEPLILTMEYSQRPTDVEALGQPNNHTVAENWYVQSEYRFDPDWQFLLRYGQTMVDMSDAEGLRYQTNTGLAAHSRYSHDWVAGLRYDFSASLMLRAEYHYVEGTNWLSPLDNPVAGEIKRQWQMFMLLGSYRF